MQPKRKQKWYDSAGQRSARRVVFQQSNPARTLISLVLLLGLVLLLLQQFSDTKKVAQIGQAIGLFEKSEVAEANDTDPRASPDEKTDITFESRRVFEALQLQADGDVASLEQSIWTCFFSRLTTEQQDLLFRFFFAPKSNVTTDEIAPLMEECSMTLKSWSDRFHENITTQQSSNALANDIELLSRMRERIEQWRSAGELTREVGSSFRIALDRVLLKRFLDNQNWMSREQIVALRSWARIRELRYALEESWLTAEQIPIVELSQLMGGDNASHRGVPIRFLGSIASADERTGRLQSEEWNGVAYRVWWMKPKEVSSQPVAVYVPIELEPSQYEEDPNPELEILGFFAKRKAYASQRGPEVAPVLFAAAVRKISGSPAKKLGPYSEWLSSNPRSLTWAPPTDFATPLRLIKSTFESIPIFPAGKSAESSLSPLALSLLLVAQKHKPELQSLSAANQAWDLSEELKIGKVSGWCSKIKVWNLEAIKAAEENREILSTLQREGFTNIFELSVQSLPNAGDKQQVVFVSSIPEAWRSMLTGDSLELWQPIEIVGFLHNQSIETQPYVVGSQIAWKIQSESSEDLSKLVPRVSDIEKYLLEKGWDLSQKDVIHQLQSPAQSLSRQEEDGLFSLIRIANEDRTKLRENASFASTPIVQIVKSSLGASSKSKQRPSLLWTECEVRIVRVTRITLDSSAQQRVLGQDHYYQLDCFADIGNVTFEIPTEGDPITYAGEYPITCLAAEVPEWLQVQQPTAGLSDESNVSSGTSDGEAELNEDVYYPMLNGKISGWFYRFWSYRTQEMTQRLGIKHRQITPLVVMSDFQITRGNTNPSSPRTITTIGWIAGLMTVGAIWWALRSYGKSKNKQSKKPIQFRVRQDRESN